MVFAFLDANKTVRRETRVKSQERAVIACRKDFYPVGEYFADYSELTDEELAVRDAEADELISRSTVVSEKVGL